MPTLLLGYDFPLAQAEIWEQLREMSLSVSIVLHEKYIGCFTVQMWFSFPKPTPVGFEPRTTRQMGKTICIFTEWKDSCQEWMDSKDSIQKKALWTETAQQIWLASKKQSQDPRHWIKHRCWEIQTHGKNPLSQEPPQL